MPSGQEKIMNPGKLLQKTRERLRSRTDFEDSIDGTRPVLIDYHANPWWKPRYSCWEAQGPVAEAYKVLGPKLLEELNQSRKESCRDVAVSLFMLGKAMKDAKPVIILSSDDKRSREDAKTAIEKSGILIDTYFELWLLRYPPSGPINPIAIENDSSVGPSFAYSMHAFADVYFDPLERVQVIGFPIYIRHSATRVRRATANAIYNGKEFGFITAAHACLQTDSDTQVSGLDQENFEMPFDSDNESDIDDGYSEQVEVLSQYSHTSSEGTESERSHVLSPQESRSRSHSNNRLPAISVPPVMQINDSSHSSPGETFKSPDLIAIEPLAEKLHEELGKVSHIFKRRDCAVISVSHQGVIHYLSQAKDVTERTENAIKVSKPKCTEVIAWTSHGPVRGSLVELPIYMCLPSQDWNNDLQPVYKFKYDGMIEMGDCGTMVTDAKTKEMYGHVIAHSERSRTAFIVAAEQIMNDIRSLGNKWQIFSFDAELSVDEPHVIERCARASDSEVEEVQKNARHIESQSFARLKPFDAEDASQIMGPTGVKNVFLWMADVDSSAPNEDNGAPASATRRYWSVRLREHCQVRHLEEPIWQDVSDRRKGRTAWSSIVVIQGNHYTARFWYDQAYREQSREDAAEMALRHITGFVNTTEEPPPDNHFNTFWSAITDPPTTEASLGIFSQSHSASIHSSRQPTSIFTRQNISSSSLSTVSTTAVCGEYSGSNEDHNVPRLQNHSH